MPASAESLKAEESRIRAAYATRRNLYLYSRFNRACLFMVEERERCFLEALSRYRCVPLATKKILEIGCGTGDLLRDFVQWGANPENVTGVDVLPDRVSEATRLCPPGMRIQQANAANLDLPNDCFDVVVQSTVFTSVLDLRIKKEIASEMCRVLKPDGLILWYDFHVSNPSNPDVKGVKPQEIRTLFPECDIRLQRITLAPPLTRLLAPYSWLTCYILSRIPWLCTHYIGVIRKSRNL